MKLIGAAHCVHMAGELASWSTVDRGTLRTWLTAVLSADMLDMLLAPLAPDVEATSDTLIVDDDMVVITGR